MNSMSNGVLTPDELVRQTIAHGVTTSRVTICRWVKQGLIPSPAIHRLGRGRGVVSEYPSSALGECVAAGALLRFQRARPEEVKEVRELALRGHDLAAFAGANAPQVLKRRDLYQWLQFADSPPADLEWLRDELYKPDGDSWTPREETRRWWLLKSWVSHASLVPSGGQTVFVKRTDGIYWLAAE